jgi:hypothetical protein
LNTFDEEDQRYDRPCDAPGTEGRAISGDWVDQSEAILSSEKSIKTPINSHYFFLGVKDDSSPGRAGWEAGDPGRDEAGGAAVADGEAGSIFATV